jgi:hypothetical protein
VAAGEGSAVHRLTRGLIELFRLAGLLGCGLSLLGLGILLWVRVEILQRQAPGGDAVATPSGALFLLDALKEAGVPFLLSAILFAVCQIALRQPAARRREPEPPGDRASVEA